ncbi:hypothetical protein CEXT_710721 [Caerostris extrusa]|uniref:Uncharacterized protein n=1 Tax=Caerostris extrusa TaxID=172846 RepID=A0AAV4NEL7_CAEEX|nr:hypothetical protein CEXT_710721 [Caerostris extrusa]
MGGICRKEIKRFGGDVMISRVYTGVCVWPGRWTAREGEEKENLSILNPETRSLLARAKNRRIGAYIVDAVSLSIAPIVRVSPFTNKPKIPKGCGERCGGEMGSLDAVSLEILFPSIAAPQMFCSLESFLFYFLPSLMV